MHTFHLLGATTGPYLLQAQIAAEHATAPTAEATNFARIADRYARLSEVAPSPIVDFNRAVAVAFSQGPDAGLALLDTLNLDTQLGEYHLPHATRADLLRSLGRPADALPHYCRALEFAPSDSERRPIQRRVDVLRAASKLVLRCAPDSRDWWRATSRPSEKQCAWNLACCATVARSR